MKYAIRTRTFIGVIVTMCLLVTILALGLRTASAVGDSVDEIKYSYGNTNDRVVFDWRGSEATIYYGLTSAYGQTATAAPSAITPQNGIGPFQEAVLTGLQTGSTYHYKIGATGLDHTFQSVPSDDFNWVDMGDSMGSACNLDAVNNGSWMPAQHQLIVNQNPAFVTHGGDIAVPNQCGGASLHQYFLDQQVWSEHAAFQPVWGDHEWEKASDAYKAAPDAIDDSNSNYKGRTFMTNAQTSVADTASKTTHPGCSTAGVSGNTCRGEDWGWFKVSGVLYISYPEVSTNSWTDWQTKADTLMADAQNDATIDFVVTYGHRPPITSASTGGVVGAYNATQALAAKYSPRANNPNGKYVLSVGHHAHSMEAFSPIVGLTYVINAAGGQGLTNWRSTIEPSSVFRSMHFGLMKGVYDKSSHSLSISMVCGPDYQYQKDSCNYGDVLYSTTFNSTQTPPAQASLTTTYTDGQTQVQSGQQLTYTATLSNPTTVSVSGASLKATLPAGSQFVSASNGVIPAGDGTVNWTVGSLAGGASISKQITVQLGTLNSGDTVASTVTASSTDGTCQNSASVCTVTDSDSVQQTAQTVEYIINQSFESNSTGWTGASNAQTKLQRISTDSYDGSTCLEVTRNTTTAGLAGDNSKPDWVTSTVAGKTYTASVWVRSQTAGQTMNLALKEMNFANQLVDSSTTSETFADTNWHQLTVTYTATASGNALKFNTYNSNLAANNWFHMDQMSLTSL